VAQSLCPWDTNWFRYPVYSNINIISLDKALRVKVISIRLERKGNARRVRMKSIAFGIVYINSMDNSATSPGGLSYSIP